MEFYSYTGMNRKQLVKNNTNVTKLHKHAWSQLEKNEGVLLGMRQECTTISPKRGLSPVSSEENEVPSHWPHLFQGCQCRRAALIQSHYNWDHVLRSIRVWFQKISWVTYNDFSKYEQTKYKAVESQNSMLFWTL